MKIVEVCPYSMSRPGGVQRHVRDLADWLTCEGHETRIVAPPAPHAAPVAGNGRLTELGHARALSVHGTSFELSIAGPGKVRALADELRGWGADLVHLHTPWTPLLAWQLWRALRLPAVTTLHATLPDDRGTGLVDRYIRRAAGHFMARSAATIVPSEAPAALLRRHCPASPVTIVPPGIDLSAWVAACRDRPADPAVAVVFMGRLEKRKGVELLLEAWAQLGPRRDGLRLTIAGDGALRGRVEAAVAADRSGRLHYAGRLGDAEARALIGSAELFVAPAPYGESFGLVLAEAMAAGAVPIAAANAGYASVLTGRGAGLLVAAGDSAALADRIASLSRDAGLRRSLREWGRAHVAQFDIRRTGPRYLRIFRHAIAP